MDTASVELLTDGIFSKALQARRMIQRGSTGLMYLPLAGIVAPSERVAGVLSKHDIDQFRGWPAALVLAAQKRGAREK